jgi:formylglycine-generating enzyme required for sulfatase activity
MHPMKIFISYARVDKPLCKQIVHELQGIHDVWYDQRLHAGEAWWDEIVSRLDWCDAFVYLLSPESVASKYCQREHALAVEAGKCIVPVLIQARTDIPENLKHLHYANLSEGMEDMPTLLNALTLAERRLLTARPAARPKPAPPKSLPADPSPGDALGKAADAMEAGDFDNAVFIIKQALDQKPKGRIARMLKAMLPDAERELEAQIYRREAAREYAPILELVKRAATRKLGCTEFRAFREDFPDYDPDNIAEMCQGVLAPPRSRTLDLMPDPFAWIDIPAGRVQLIPDDYDKKNSYLKSDTWFDVPAFRIAKYPITNAQFARFIESGGYADRQWWTDTGWDSRLKGMAWNSDKREYVETGTPWTEPRYWQDDKWNGADQPVVGVSWYEAVAFCRWLSDVTGEAITLPTEQQWQRAAQGDDGREYPWGNTWDKSRCNTGKAASAKRRRSHAMRVKATAHSGWSIWQAMCGSGV